MPLSQLIQKQNNNKKQGWFLPSCQMWIPPFSPHSILTLPFFACSYSFNQRQRVTSSSWPHPLQMTACSVQVQSSGGKDLDATCHYLLLSLGSSGLLRPPNLRRTLGPYWWAGANSGKSTQGCHRRASAEPGGPTGAPEVPEVLVWIWGSSAPGGLASLSQAQ